ncbi:MAG: acyltransferase [Candidatus Pacebacteria bacterium]|nr:acyltransferase [Candidatus Paceibacterota bacterium]
MKSIIKIIKRSLSFFRRLKFFANRKIKIGKNIYIGPRVKLKAIDGGSIIIGDNCEINECTKIFSGGGKIIIEENCMINDYVQIGAMEADITIHSNSSINSFCFISSRGSLTIGSNVAIGPQVVIITDNHKFSDKNIPIKHQGDIKGKIIIGDDVWVGAGCKILSGVKIGNGVVVGAGAVVTKNLEPFKVYAGVPAKFLKDR